MPPPDHPTFGAWRTATQRNQADLLRHHIETLRRLKYRPTGGFCFSWLADPAPMISASVLDHERRPKLAWQCGRRCLPAGDRRDHRSAAGRAPRPATRCGSTSTSSTTCARRSSATVSATASWRGGRRQWAFRGDVDADSCVLVGRLELAVPERPGELLLGIALTGRTDTGRAISATRRAGARMV